MKKSNHSEVCFFEKHYGFARALRAWFKDNAFLLDSNLADEFMNYLIEVLQQVERTGCWTKKLYHYKSIIDKDPWRDFNINADIVEWIWGDE